jgi:hypothetical protein
LVERDAQAEEYRRQTLVGADCLLLEGGQAARVGRRRF